MPKKNAHRFQETGEKLNATDRNLQEALTSPGMPGNPLGEFVEERVKPVLVRLYEERGIAMACNVSGRHRRVRQGVDRC